MSPAFTYVILYVAHSVFYDVSFGSNNKEQDMENGSRWDFKYCLKSPRKQFISNTEGLFLSFEKKRGFLYYAFYRQARS
jgi:hypothetical protein